uniref:Scavenger receptor cysteine-rich type 1 protein M130-like n=1 Tax=Oryzias melastigma TaxID=30732 RepID=A0A3B3E1M2_ORYME
MNTVDVVRVLMLLHVSGFSSGLCAELHSAGSEEFRLVGGASRCSGRLERKVLEGWEAVVEENYNLNWTLEHVDVVCKSLDCGSVVSMRRIKVSYKFTVEIICSDSIRLVNHLCSGRLEVMLNGSWSSVNEDDFDQQDAEVVCRELGCGPPSGLQGAFYGETEAPEWSRDFLCEGHESALLKCRSSVQKYSGKAAGLTCSDSGNIRLVGGDHYCTGKLNMKYKGEWILVGGSHINMKFAESVCELLDCGSLITFRGRRQDSRDTIWGLDDSCDRSNLMKCRKFIDQGCDFYEITCSESIRLVNGDNQCSGRLEVKSNNWWSIVCEGDFDQHDAEVVCRELDCGVPSFLQGALYGETEAPEWSRDFLCKGHESALLDCKSSSSSQKFCSSGKAVELTCSGRLKLVGMTSRCAGVLEMFNHREWRPVDVGESQKSWNHEDATAVCSQLGCGFAVFQEITHNSTLTNKWRISASCLKSLSNDCFLHFVNLFTNCKLEVSCSDSLESPNISVSSSCGVSKARNQGLQIFFGTSFSIICSSHHLYQGGIFQLIFNNSTTTLNNTLPAVNNSALFSFLEASHAHQGDYICVHHVHINSQNLTLQSQQLSLTVLVSVSGTEFIIRHVVVLLIMVVSTSALYVYFKTKSRRMQEPKRNRPVDDGPALRPRERRRLREN